MAGGNGTPYIVGKHSREWVAHQTAPNRMAFLYVPNGKIMEHWTPKQIGANYELTDILKPLENVKDKMLMISGLTADKARANGDGGGDHARAMAAFLTGAQPRKLMVLTFRLVFLLTRSRHRISVTGPECLRLNSESTLEEEREIAILAIAASIHQHCHGVLLRTDSQRGKSKTCF